MFLDFTAKSVFETFSQTCPVGLEVEPCLNSDLSMSKYYTIEDAVDGDFTVSIYLFLFNIYNELIMSKNC